MAFEITFPAIPQIRAYAGPAGSGKNDRLIEDVKQALAEGAGSARIAVLCPRASAVSVMRSSLERMIGPKAENLTVTTPRELELAALSKPEAAQWLEREPRMMADFETLFFLEDMRVTGSKQHRLKEMLKFFYRSITELEDRNPEWLISGEEESIYELMQQSLAFGGGLLPAEVSNKAATWLEANAEARKAAGFDQVFVAGYETLNRASQLFVQLITAKKLVVTFDPYRQTEAEDPYPYAAGLDELVKAHPDTTVVKREELSQSAPVANMVRNLLAFGCMQRNETAASDADGTSPAEQSETEPCPVVHTKMLRSEFATVANLVNGQIQAGTDPEHIYVAVPNRVWGVQIARALRNLDIPSSQLDSKQALKGDIRDLQKSQSMQLFCALALAANPESPIAWRCWIGFGDYLGASAGISGLRKWANEQNVSLPQAISALIKGNLPKTTGSSLITERARKAASYLDAVKHLTGPALVNAAAHACNCENVPSAIKGLLGTVHENDSANELFERAYEALISPAFAPGTVRIGSWEAALGQHSDVIVVAGCMNGFTPKDSYFDLTQVTIDQKKKLHDKLIRSLYALASQAHKEIICSVDDCATLEDAERLSLSYKRVQLVEGQRMVTLEPSIVIDFLNGKDEVE